MHPSLLTSIGPGLVWAVVEGANSVSSAALQRDWFSCPPRIHAEIENFFCPSLYSRKGRKVEIPMYRRNSILFDAWESNVCVDDELLSCARAELGALVPHRSSDVLLVALTLLCMCRST